MLASGFSLTGLRSLPLMASSCRAIGPARLYPCTGDDHAAPHALCVIHTHSSWLVDLTLRGVWSQEDVVPPITPYYVMKVGHVPPALHRLPETRCVADDVARIIDEHVAARGIALRAAMRSAGSTGLGRNPARPGDGHA